MIGSPLPRCNLYISCADCGDIVLSVILFKHIVMRHRRIPSPKEASTPTPQMLAKLQAIIIDLVELFIIDQRYS